MFNMAFDAVVRHWFKVMVEGTDNQSGCGQEGSQQNYLFYTDDGMVVLSDPGWL